MIINSMSRKVPTFAQLASYIEMSAVPGDYSIAHNVYDGMGAEGAALQFRANYANLPKRKNGNALYHEIIALEPQPHLYGQTISEHLVTLAKAYCQKRAPEQMAWGRVHLDRAHPHIHLMISSNDIGSAKRKRLDKKAFAEIQKDMERFVDRELPDLINTPVYSGARSDHIKHTRGEAEQTRRTGSPSQKDELRDKLSSIFERSIGTDQLQLAVKNLGFELYQRGKTVGVRDQKTGRKYRLKTLGLETSFELAMNRKPKVQTLPSKHQHQTPLVRQIPDLKPSDTKQPDPRAAKLLRQKQALERFSQDHLRDFDQEFER